MTSSSNVAPSVTSSSSALNFLTGELAGLTISVEPEYTRGQVTSAYDSQITTFQDVLNLANQNPGPLQLANAAADLTSAISNLLVTGRDGIVSKIDANDPNSPSVPYYFTQDMASKLDSVLQSLQIAGATIQANASGPPTVNINAANVRKWLDLSLVSPVVGTLVSDAVGSTEGATSSLQALTELVYVRTGNEVLSQQLAAQEQAIQATQSTLNVLKSVQDIHNQISTVPTPDLVIPGTNEVSSPTDFEEKYIASANQALVPIGIKIDETKTGVTRDLAAELINAQSALANELLVLASVAGTSSAIYEQTNTVYQEIVAANASPEAFAKWFADGYSNIDSQGNFISGSGAQQGSGAIQSNINSAISSTQALNNTQQQEVSQSLFVFEEYYKSASSILDNLTQIIQRVAQNISR